MQVVKSALLVGNRHLDLLSYRISGEYEPTLAQTSEYGTCS